MSDYLELTVHEKLAVEAALGARLGTETCPCPTCNDTFGAVYDDDGKPIHMLSVRDWYEEMCARDITPIFSPAPEPKVEGELTLTWAARKGGVRCRKNPMKT